MHIIDGLNPMTERKRENHRSPAMDNEIAVIVVPIPVQSHLNQLLQFSALISSHAALPIHYLGSATHNRQVRLRAFRGHPSTIHFHDLPTPPISSPDPIRSSSAHPTQIGPSLAAYIDLQHPIAAFVRQLSTNTRRTVLIYDWFIADAVKLAVSIPNVESYGFNCFSAFNMFLILWESMGRPFQLEDELLCKLPSVRECFPEWIIDFVLNKPDEFRSREGDIQNTSRLIEAKYMDLLSKEEFGGRKKQWAIRPTLLDYGNEMPKSKSKCLEWLDKQAPKSVVYISFGTLISFSDEEVREIAIGLEESKQKFIWLLRDADRADVFSGEVNRVRLPDGFEERVGEDGIVERDWVPQFEILCHESIGGFVSHCGWNSCYESFVAGVPMAAWPLHNDQHLNAVFLTEFLRMGFMVREWGKREEAVEAAMVKEAVERLMSSEEGDEIRQNAAEISAAVRECMKEGGEFWREVDDFIAHVTR